MKSRCWRTCASTSVRRKDDEALAKAYASLCDIFVMDAFGTAHRAQASTHGVARFAPVACAGPLLEGELLALEQALSKPARPMVAIVGGSKVSTKLKVLEALSDKVDQLVVGGGIANTFLAASGSPVGQVPVRARPARYRAHAHGKDQYSTAEGCRNGQGVCGGYAGQPQGCRRHVVDDDMNF